jgi:hypothetical protein
MRCHFPQIIFLEVIIFGSVWFKKKIIKSKFKKKWNQTETGSNRPISVRFNLEPGSNRFDSVFSVLARVFFGFFCLARFFFFSFRLIKSKPNRTSWFFQNSNWFFSRFDFFGYFFLGFLGLIRFSIFLLTPLLYSRWYVIR